GFESQTADQMLQLVRRDPTERDTVLTLKLRRARDFEEERTPSSTATAARSWSGARWLYLSTCTSTPRVAWRSPGAITEVLQQPSIDSFAREEPGSRRRDVIVETRWSRARAMMIGHYGQLFVSWHRRPTMSMTCSPSFPPMNP